MRWSIPLLVLSTSLLALGLSLSGCSPGTEGDAGKMVTGKMDGAMDTGKMDGAMGTGKMESGKMDGAMDTGKMDGGAMGKGKMEEAPK